ncbi:MAG: hypothetical protein MI754_17225 [Chromatiales bacterium]|nr:hypothetical protein [Chromatiales bacterium]
MDKAKNSAAVSAIVEVICNKGCQQVRQDIALLEQGVLLPEVSSLEAIERQAVLVELQSIMAVYGDSCRI